MSGAARINWGFCARALEEAGFQNIRLQPQGQHWTTSERQDLKILGYKPDNMPGAALKQLSNVGFTAWDVRQQGFGTFEMLLTYGPQGPLELMLASLR